MSHDSHNADAHADGHQELEYHDAPEDHNVPMHHKEGHASHGAGLGFIKEKKGHLVHSLPDNSHSHDSPAEEHHHGSHAQIIIPPEHHPIKTEFKLRNNSKHYVAMCMSCGRQSIYEMKNGSNCCNIISNLKFMRVFNDSEEAKNFIKYQEV
ncbi:MAG: hypothetical protein NDI94_05140 [Candidatus Woesearchaeota archaeon]|nr:hypothetical protein [Candidatus Woesearchaeota archaeon]